MGGWRSKISNVIATAKTPSLNASSTQRLKFSYGKSVVPRKLAAYYDVPSFGLQVGGYQLLQVRQEIAFCAGRPTKLI